MTAKHQTPEYQRNARIIRARTRALQAAGVPVMCWRCRTPIYPGQPFDAGHLPGAQGSSLEELRAEHRSRTSHCKGNRAAGAELTNRRPATLRTKVQTWPL